MKFNEAQIKLDSKKIVLTKESYVDGILLNTNHDADAISSREIIRKKLLPKKQYLAQKVRAAYIASMYQLKVSFDFS